MQEFSQLESRGAWSGFNPCENIIPAAALQDPICRRVLQPGGVFAVNPFSEKFQLRTSELTIWAGQNGSGKSALMNQMALSLLQQGQKVCLFSFEMSPETTLLHMIRCCLGRDPTTDDVCRFFDWCEPLLWIYRAQGALEPGYAIDGVFYAADRLKCADCFVDNLMMLTSGGSSDSLMQSQKCVVQSLKEISTQTGARVHLVAHVRKPPATVSEYKPTRYDVAGNADISNLADNVVLINRNFAKERSRETGTFDDSEPDTVLSVDKQRETGALVTVPLWFHPSGQFCRTSARITQNFMEASKPDDTPEDFSDFPY